jgi:hypothetical protein
LELLAVRNVREHRSSGLRLGLTGERARGQVGASADGTGLDELDRHANARQLKALRWRAAVAERLRSSVLEHLAEL